MANRERRAVNRDWQRGPDCSYYEAHVEFHVAHPLGGGKAICTKCHPLPPNAGVVSKAMQRAIDMGVRTK